MIRDSGLCDHATLSKVDRDDSAGSSAHHIRAVVFGGEIGSRHAQRNRRIGLTRFHIQAPPSRHR